MNYLIICHLFDFFHILVAMIYELTVPSIDKYVSAADHFIIIYHRGGHDESLTKTLSYSAPYANLSTNLFRDLN